jgi:hypothetical protein
MGKVFISYSHDTPEHSKRVLELAWALRNHGIDVELDQFHNEEIVDWPRWCNEQTSRECSDFVVCVCTVEYRHRIEGKVPPEKGKGVYWEGSLLDDDLYDEKGNSRLVPIRFDGGAESSIPRFLRGWTHCLIRQFALNDPGYEHLLRILTKQSKVEKNSLGTVPVLPTERAPTGSQSSAKTNFKADISRILKYAPAQLIGREDETKLLNDAWAGRAELPLGPDIGAAQQRRPTRPHVLTFVALGGEGKTSLVAKWAAELAAQDWPGCDTAFAWSFYSQGTREQLAASSDLFLKAALTFFGDDADKAFAASPAGAFEKGQRLARLVGQRRSLLILDGLEPLQYASASPTPGQLKDQGVAALLKGLAAASHGLCVVTTRYSLPDLRAFWQTTAPEVKLLRLSRDAGVHLLKTLGVTGTAQEFATLVEDVKGHALTLTLLGGFLKRAFHGDIRQRDRVKFEKADEKMDGGHAFRTMAAYEQWLLRDGGDEGRREVAVLRLMGLFDRPADAGCLAVLRSESIPGLTEPLAGLADDDWEFCLSGLEAAKLLTVNRDAAGALVSLDAHPHLREYFARQLRTQQPDAWRGAHRRLYDHLCNHREGDQPTLEDLQPLYQAVAHGCQAGLGQKVYWKLYTARIQGARERSPELQCYPGMDVAVVASFFEVPWNKFRPGLHEGPRAWVLDWTAQLLAAAGRLREACEVGRAAVSEFNRLGNWMNGLLSATHLSEMELQLGDIQSSLHHAEQAVEFAHRISFLRLGLQNFLFGEFSDGLENLKRSWKPCCPGGCENYGQARTILAAALLCSGRKDEALRVFAESGQQTVMVFNELRDGSWHRAQLAEDYYHLDARLVEVERTAWRKFKIDPHLQFATATDASAGLNQEMAAFLNCCRELEANVSQPVETLARFGQKPSLHESAFGHLAIARSKLYRAILDDSNTQDRDATLQSSYEHINAAVEELRRKGHVVELCFGLITRAWLRILTGARTGPERAQADLDEAWEIAERGPMKLFLADIHLHRARLFFREPEYPWNKHPDGTPRGPKDDLAAAEKLITTCGYHRRDEELADAKRAILT